MPGLPLSTRLTVASLTPTYLATSSKTETQSAARAPSFSQATDHQWKVRPGGGQLALRSGLKELTRTSASGM